VAEPINWAQVARDLERFGRGVSQVAREAQWLSREASRLGDAWQRSRPAFKTNLQLTFWMAEQIEAAKRNPSHRTARRWSRLKGLTPKQIDWLMDFMVMEVSALRVPQRRGKRTAVTMREMAEQTDRRIRDKGELPTTAAKRVLAEHGRKGDLKGRADYLVRAWNRAFNSR
jgi:hypothetical protein